MRQRTWSHAKDGGVTHTSDMRPIAVVISLLLTMGINAQSYIPLLQPGAAWEDDNQYHQTGIDLFYHQCIRYSIAGDSVVNDTSYFILRGTGSTHYSYANTPDLNQTYWYYGLFIALLREDTMERRVYIRSYGGASDRLFYDFSAGVGLYPPTYRFDFAEDMEVTSVDTVWLSDGPHRRLNFYDGWYAIIEGIGYTWGFMNCDLQGEPTWPGHLVCHSVGSFVNYHENESWSSCACTATVGMPANLAPSLILGPSPTTGLCHVLEAPHNAPYIIRSMEGRGLRHGNCSSNGNTTIDLTGLSAGVYVLEVRGSNGSLKARIVKE